MGSDQHSKTCLTAQLSPWRGQGIYVNPQYKFIFIKNAKTAGTTVEREILEPWLCPLQEGQKAVRDHGALRPIQPGCYNQSFSDLRSMPEDEIKRIWDDYFVFTIVRNPWSRFASAMDYLGLADRPCKTVLSEVMTIPHGPRLATHLQAQTACMMAESGGWAVDYIGSTEDLETDLKNIHAVLSARAGKEIP